MTGIDELHMVKLIVLIGYFEGYANFTINYNIKFEQRTKIEIIEHGQIS